MSISEAVELDRIDVSDPQLYQDDTWRQPFARLRDEDPVHYCPQSAYGPYWSVTRYDDIVGVDLNHEVFSSSSTLGGIQIGNHRTPAESASFIRLDPPRHTEARKTITPMMAPSNLVNMQASIRERTAAVLDGLPRGQEFDWVERVSVELSAAMLATLFDFPWQDRHQLAHWSDVVAAHFDAPDAPVRSHYERNIEMQKMATYFVGLWRQRKRQPQKFDLISMLAHGPSGRTTSVRQFVSILALLIVGGNDTTRNTMTGGLLALHDNPQQWHKLRADPTLVPSMVAETIRYQTPAIHMRRTARIDTELGGKTIRRGDKVVMWYISGNRDERAIAQPDRFIIDRPKPRQHLAFGSGIHRCIGDRLAEMQLRILWEEVLARDLRIEVVGTPRRIYSNFLRGFRSMPVRIAG